VAPGVLAGKLAASPRLRTGALGRTLDWAQPAAGADVMATGIVSTGLSLDGQETLSKITLGIAAFIWVALGILLPLRAARDPAGFRADARSPGALTGSVATAVLGTRLVLLGWAWAGIVALLIALVLWAVLVGPVLASWRSPTVGTSLLLSVSAESLAVLVATLAEPEQARWLVIAALVLFGLGLGFYVFVISRFDLRQLAVGRGDHWITGGALGISTLAAAKIVDSARVLGSVVGGGRVLEDIAIGLWVLTMMWLLVLLFAEARWRRFRYDARRWSTVFPLGMYCVSSFAVGALAHVSPITSFARVWIWIGFASWAVVFAATIPRVVELVRGHERSGAEAPSPP
jgi:tellurite resistance protein TehA-like permease